MTNNWKNLLWEYDKSKKKIDDDISIIRIVMYGDVEDLRVLIENVPLQKIQAVIRSNFYQLDKKTQAFCKAIFQIEGLQVNTENIYEKFSKNIPTRNIG